MKHVNYAIMNPIFLATFGHDINAVDGCKKFLPIKFDYDCRLVLYFRAFMKELGLTFDPKSADCSWGHYQVESNQTPNIALNHAFFMYPLQESEYTLVTDTGTEYIVDAKTFGLVVSLIAFAHISALAANKDSRYSDLIPKNAGVNFYINAKQFGAYYKYTKQCFYETGNALLTGNLTAYSTSRDAEQIKGLMEVVSQFIEQSDDIVTHDDI